MSWSLLAYAIPMFGAFKLISAVHPATYRKYEEAPESTHSDVVKAVAERVLTAENQVGARYREKVRDLVEELPDSVGVKNVQAVVSSRLKVVLVRNEATPIHSTGTGIDIGGARGRYFIGIDPDAEKIALDALHWISAHEICHLLEDDWVEMAGVKTVASFSATLFSSLILGWSLWPSVGAALLANIATHAVMSHRAENRADDFANKHCTVEEREKALLFLEQIKNSRQEGISGHLGRVFRFALHPSEEVRMMNIRTSLVPAGQRKTA